MNNSSTIRGFARESLSGNWLNAVLAYLIIIGIISVVSTLQVVTWIILGSLTYGLYLYYIVLIREKAGDFNLLFKAFSFSEKNLGLFGKTLGLYLLMSLYIFLWTLLLIVPGIIAAYSYRIAFYLMIDNPEIGVSEALKQSKEMMYGYKSKLFCLDLSFIGWGLLCILSFGIGILWLSPYMLTSQTIFYEELRNEHILTYEIKDKDINNKEEMASKVDEIVK
ncbi:MAG: hypothetical protein DRH89_04485 [Candidatus Cloacimonadota bacterium]|nr:MAG: hypothetical protein DRH89_04485 [Candidatus Cloacimonadota bacterium]